MGKIFEFIGKRQEIPTQNASITQNNTMINEWDFTELKPSAVRSDSYRGLTLHSLTLRRRQGGFLAMDFSEVPWEVPRGVL